MKRSKGILCGVELVVILAIRQHQPASTYQVESAVKEATGVILKRGSCFSNIHRLRVKGFVMEDTMNDKDRDGRKVMVWSITNEGNDILRHTMKTLRTLTKLPE